VVRAHATATHIHVWRYEVRHTDFRGLIQDRRSLPFGSGQMRRLSERTVTLALITLIGDERSGDSYCRVLLTCVPYKLGRFGDHSKEQTLTVAQDHACP